MAVIKALDWVHKALEADPKLVEAHELLAELTLEESDTDGAIKQADAALQLSLRRWTPWPFMPPWN